MLTSCIITAREAGNAKRQGAGSIARHHAELRASKRLVAVLGALESPIATAIRLLADEPTTVR